MKKSQSKLPENDIKRKEKYTDKKGEKEVKSRVKNAKKIKPKIALKLR